MLNMRGYSAVSHAGIIDFCGESLENFEDGGCACRVLKSYDGTGYVTF